MASLPNYVASAKPVPQASRVPWFKTTAQTYAGIMLWFVFWESVPTSGATTPGRHPGPWNHDSDSRGDRRGPHLPLCQLSCPGPDGHEDGPAAGGRRDFDLRRAGRIPHARLLHGRAAIRLVGGQLLLLRQAPRLARGLSGDVALAPGDRQRLGFGGRALWGSKASSTSPRWPRSCRSSPW